MTARRLLATLSITAFVSGGLIAIAAPASADPLCIGGENQRKPGSYQGICIGDPIETGTVFSTIGKLGG